MGIQVIGGNIQGEYDDIPELGASKQNDMGGDIVQFFPMIMSPAGGLMHPMPEKALRNIRAMIEEHDADILIRKLLV